MNSHAKLAVLFLIASASIFGVGGSAYGETGCVDRIPDVIISPSHLIAPPGSTAVFTVDVENEDSDNCPLKQFTMNGSTDSGFSVSFSPSTVFISPGDRETALMKVTIPSDAVATEYEATAVANNGNFSGTDVATLEVRQDVEECEVQVSNLRFKEKNSDEFDNEFAKDDEVSVLVDVSLLGNAVSDVTLDLYVEGNVLDSETDSYPGNSDTTFRFGNKIFTKNYNDDFDVRVVATASCSPTETDEDTDTVEIIEAEDDIDLEVRVGKPANTMIGKEIITRIFLENNGEENVDVNLDAKLCRSGYGCQIEMNCGDSTILIEGDDVVEIACRATPALPGKYRADVEVTFEGDSDIERSNEFFVYSTAAELAGQSASAEANVAPSDEQAEKIKEIRSVCTGNLRQAVFTTTEGVKISDIEFCPNGCSHGSCVQRSVITKKITGPIVDIVSEGPDTEPSRPQYNKPEFGTDDFLGWLKNLWFSITS